MNELAPGIWTHATVAEGFPVVCGVVLTERRAFVIDTLTGPGDMGPVLEFLLAHAGGRRVIVVNTHHHWDHVYGNAAFPEADIVAQQACPRLIQAQLASADESLPLPPAEGVPLPAVTFGDRLTYAGPDETVHLLHAPGHSEDSLVVFLTRARILFAGDTLEWPLPNFGQRGGMATWVATLRQLKQVPVDLIVPSHGVAMDKSIIDANERYIVDVYQAVAAAKARGVRRGELDLPPARFLSGGAVADAVYEAVHRENLLWAWDEV